MQFVKNGPDVPESLLQAHEEGRVVFFCGAGISYPAGLPDFRGLVDSIYSELHATRSDLEEQAYKKQQYDATLDLLERRIPGQRASVRVALFNVLKPNLRKKGATATHAALIQLGRDRSGSVRLVTTNFDRVFDGLMKRAKPSVPGFPAPLLPIPKSSRWNGIVYLHGLLPETPDHNALNRLIVSSGDFGLAYLTERWAARFVGELFRNYVVCFVGYSINDPVLRYMMDALAADRMLGESSPQAYAFGSFSAGKEEIAEVEWKAKGVTPILYESLPAPFGHSALHLTLAAWANTYRDGVIGKEGIVATYAVNPPTGSTKEDNFVGRTLWALCDSSGLPARRFADLDPVPPLDWLEPLTNEQFLHDDLPRFGVPVLIAKDVDLRFSLARRPAPYTRSPWMSLVSASAASSNIDDVMYQLARWLLRHLNDRKLLLWFANRGGLLHQQFAWLLQRRLEELDKLRRDGNQAELDRLTSNAPNAIPGPAMLSLWGLLLSGRVKSFAERADAFEWLDRFKKEGPTATLRIHLRELLSPRVSLSEPFSWGDEVTTTVETPRVSDLVRWEVVLATRHAHSTFGDRLLEPRWQGLLPLMLSDFSLLLRDVLDLRRELGGAGDQSDHSYSDRPSISDHLQNNDFRDWTVLIDLTRDAWVATVKVDVDEARRVAESWWLTPYPLFKRMALFAATEHEVITADRGLHWLLEQGAWWLWSEETRREVMRWLARVAGRLPPKSLRELQSVIVAGPPREMFREDIDDDRWRRVVDHGVWLRLAKIKGASVTLSASADAKLRRLLKKHPTLKLASDERDEFPVWMESASWGTDDDILDEARRTPRRRRDLVRWLKAHPQSGDHWNPDDWRARCTDDFSTTSCALFALACEGEWPADRWRDALQAWSEDKLLVRSWRFMGTLVAVAPDELIESCSHGISWWLRSVANTFVDHLDAFLALGRRVLVGADPVETTTGNPVTKAINHPVGHVVEGLLRWWYRQSPKDGQGLATEIESVFTSICDTATDRFIYGRVVLAAHAISLFRVDGAWATARLLPLFDWTKSELEASAAWEGFLWSPRLYRPLLVAFKASMLKTSLHYGQIGEHARQYAEFLTFAALDPGDTFTVRELADATAALPPSGLVHAAQALCRALEGAGDQRAEHWRNRIRPYWLSVWPKLGERISPEIAEPLGRLCVAADDSFPDAVTMLKDWLVPVEHPHFLIHLLSEAELPMRYPDAALEFMDCVIGSTAKWAPDNLGKCLSAVEGSSASWASDARYMRLLTYHRAHGGT